MSVLAELVSEARVGVASRRRRVPAADLDRGVPRATVSLRAALGRRGVRFIFECKRASPSAGALRADVDPSAFATALDGVADAFSVLTSAAGFGGSHADLAAVRAATDRPILCKDFIVEPYQVLEARAAGADAVLLMLSVLDDGAYSECAAAAAELGLETLTEVHDERELERALALGAPMVGINNRNLHTLEVDLATTERLAPLVPHDRLVISESGIAARADVRRLARHADGFLVGTSVMRAARPDLAARALACGVVKVCGLASPGDARLAYEAGASYGGVIFAAESPRRVGVPAARRIAAAAPLPLVGVFVNAAPGDVAAAAAEVPLAAVQLHGEEDAAYIAALRALLPAGCEVWQRATVDTVPERIAGDRLLWDAPAADGRRGGSGRTFDWSRIPRHAPVPTLLAGGLHPGNAAEAERAGCDALDVCSGLEASPGVKDAAAVHAFFAALRALPDRHDTVLAPAPAVPTPSRGRFGEFGGMYVPELLVPALDALADAFDVAIRDAAFGAELEALLRDYAGRETPLYRCRRFAPPGSAAIYLKREDLLHGGAHKTNQVLGQALLARRMGRTRLIAETGAGQHGVATAIAGALFGMETRVYMGAKDVRRQAPNVARMQLMGAEVVPVGDERTGGLKQAINEALRDWSATSETTHYLLGTAAGPHPFPTMVREFQRVIGRETRRQIVAATGRLPDAVIACVGGGSNAIGMFADFVGDAGVRLIGVEAGGRGLESGAHGATLARGTPGILHGCRTLLLQDDEGQVRESHSVSAGLDYPAVGPEHAHLQATGRAEYVSVTDDEALGAFRLLAQTEGIIPALESAHALAEARRLAATLEPDRSIVVCLSGRGDKDLAHAASHPQEPAA